MCVPYEYGSEPWRRFALSRLSVLRWCDTRVAAIDSIRRRLCNKSVLVSVNGGGDIGFLLSCAAVRATCVDHLAVVRQHYELPDSVSTYYVVVGFCCC